MHRLAVVLAAEQQAAASHLCGRQTRLANDAPDVVRHVSRSASLDDFVGHGAQSRAAPGHGHTHFARVEQIVVVLCVADADRVVNRQLQRAERVVQAP